MRRSVDWRRIGENRAAGHLDAISVTATEIATGRVVVFLEAATGGGLDARSERWCRARSSARDHALASAAIPVVFPTVRVDGTYFADGGIRLNTPLAPALRLGADRVLVIPLRRGAGDESEGSSRPRESRPIRTRSSCTARC